MWVSPEVSLTVSLKDILDFAAGDILATQGRLDRSIEGLAPITAGRHSSQLTFCTVTGEKGLELIQSTLAGTIVVSVSMATSLPIPMICQEKTLLFVDNPRLSFSRMGRRFFLPPPPTGIHPTAVIGDNVAVGEQVFIGPHAFVDNARIGNRVRINAGAVIGCDSFGYEQNRCGDYEFFPHLGCVAIGDDVHIGASAIVDRGALGDTIIERGAKVGGRALIGHNVFIGRNSLITPHAILLGSVWIGTNCWIAPCACVREGVRIGNHSMVGAGAVVLKNVGENAVVIGNPARFLRNRYSFTPSSTPAIHDKSSESSGS